MIRKEKDDIRRECIARRKEITPAEKHRRDSKICTLAQSLVSFRYAEVILMYAPTAKEIDVMPLISAALARGKEVAFPKCAVENRTMEYHFVTGEGDLSVQSHNIREPDGSLPLYNPKKDRRSAVCLVPALVYDRAGYRLGYGKGYYDRYLSDFEGCKIGVVYSDFILPSVPRGRFDLNVDILLTEKGIKTPIRE
jgi:5-formyltetrahydrofolate cyclo-ligase